jgi:predicted acetyltransferase
MSLTTRWLGRESIDTIADVRMRCYGTSAAERTSFLARSQRDRFVDGDVLLAEEKGHPIGTATHLSLQICPRGGRVPCQGVAWVGTVKSHRRRRVDGHGIASTIMRQIVQRGRDRGDVVSSLMPFRGSFYEHFGYGIVERQNIWTVPLSLLPSGDTDGFRYAEAGDIDAMAACRVRQTQIGQCDVDGGVTGIRYWLKELEDYGFTFVDRPDPKGPVRAFVTVGLLMDGDSSIAVVDEPAYDSMDSLVRLLAFLSTFKDQYSFARLILPADLNLNWLLKERQMPHRRVDHPFASCKTISRMQIRILDHKTFLEAMTWPAATKGKAIVAVKECEGHESRFVIEVSGGKASVTVSDASPQVTLLDSVWAGVVSGALPAPEAKAMRLLESTDDAAIQLLAACAEGPAPFSWEYF